MKRRWTFVLGALMAVALAGCASDWQERYELSSRENKDLADQMEQVRNAAAMDATRAEAAAEKAKALERENQQILDERNRVADLARKWQSEAEKLEAMSKSADPASGATGRSVAETAATKLRADGYKSRVDENGNVEITLSSDVNFPSGSEQLSEAGKKDLRALASKLNGEFAPYMIRVEGHTDNEPLNRVRHKYGDNLGLSTARANAVARFMQDEMRIDASRLISAGRGEQEPIADNKTVAGKARNRRVEIKVMMGVQAR